MKKIKILLTGGNGFIGRNILEILGDKFIFLAPGHEELNLLDSQKVFEYLKNNPVDLVIHAANRGGSRLDKDSAEVTSENLKIFFNLIRAKEFFTRMIMLGSGAEYDKSRDIVKIKEDNFDEAVPKDAYGFYKYVCAKYAQQADFITHLRFFGVYGKYEDYRVRFISNNLCKALLGLPLTMKQNVLFDYIYVKDLVRILEHFINHKPKDVFYNIGRGEPIDLESLAHKILEITGQHLPFTTVQSGLGREYTCDVNRLKKELPVFKYTGLEDSLREMSAYYFQILPTLNREDFLKDV